MIWSLLKVTTYCTIKWTLLIFSCDPWDINLILNNRQQSILLFIFPMWPLYPSLNIDLFWYLESLIICFLSSWFHYKLPLSLTLIAFLGIPVLHFVKKAIVTSTFSFNYPPHFYLYLRHKLSSLIAFHSVLLL